MSVVMVTPVNDQFGISEDTTSIAMRQLPVENKPPPAAAAAAAESTALQTVQVDDSHDEVSGKTATSSKKPFNPNDFIDIPLLIPDHEGLTDDDEEDGSFRASNTPAAAAASQAQINSQVTSTQTSFQSMPSDLQSSGTVPIGGEARMRFSFNRNNGGGIHKNYTNRYNNHNGNVSMRGGSGLRSSYSTTSSHPSRSQSSSLGGSRSSLTPLMFFQERTRLMAIIVKYIATKIENSFPPDSSRGISGKNDELELDKVMFMVVARLGLTLPLFLKLIIYLFRYMDIVYLLRYLNQLNNMANYQLMDFGLKQLIIGCFKLTVEMERQEEIKSGVTDIVTGMQGLAGHIYTKDWEAITGFNMTEVDVIALTISKRLNGKLTIKTMELLKLKSEIFRFVRMVSTTV